MLFKVLVEGVSLLAGFAVSVPGAAAQGFAGRAVFDVVALGDTDPVRVVILAVLVDTVAVFVMAEAENAGRLARAPVGGSTSRLARRVASGFLSGSPGRLPRRTSGRLARRFASGLFSGSPGRLPSRLPSRLASWPFGGPSRRFARGIFGRAVGGSTRWSGSHALAKDLLHLLVFVDPLLVGFGGGIHSTHASSSVVSVSMHGSPIVSPATSGIDALPCTLPLS